VVIKPARDAFAFASAAEACGFPPAVINVITGGRDVGAYLVAHPLVNKVAFNGSTAAERAIGEICGRLLRPVTLELGGKSAAIMLDDADLAETVRGLSWASLLNNGQTCYLSSRILAHGPGTTRSLTPLRTSPGRSGWATRSTRPRASDRWSRNSSASAWKASSQPAAPKAPASLRAADVRRTSTGVGTSSHRPC